jgi:hypothetical protein
VDSRRHPEEFEEIIAHRPAETQGLARGARDLIFDVLPETVEVVWTHQQTAGYGTGPKKMSEQFCYLTLAEWWIGLGFYYGAELDDPAHLLEGTGRMMRRVKIESLADLRRPELRALIEQATRHRVPPPTPL